jgi:hypothetical protein
VSSFNWIRKCAYLHTQVAAAAEAACLALKGWANKVSHRLGGALWKLLEKQKCPEMRGNLVNSGVLSLIS